MAQITLQNMAGEELTVPDRLNGEGPEIMIIVCEAGEFIDAESKTLRFMLMPEPPVIERLQVSTRPVAKEVEFNDAVWLPTDDELDLAREEGDEIRRLLRGYYG